MGLGQKRIANFMGVSHDKVVQKNGRNFRIVLYQAYNAFGLIGSEHNGVAILDEDTHQVVSMNHGKVGSGYYGPQPTQIQLFEEICEMEWSEFCELSNSSTYIQVELDA